MRFYLDEDVDAACQAVIRALGHTCWTTSQAKMVREADESQLIYAQNQKAVLVTHDQGFARRHRERTLGQMVHLNCLEPDAVEVVSRHWPSVVHNLQFMELVTIEVRLERIQIWPPRFGDAPGEP